MRRAFKRNGQDVVLLVAVLLLVRVPETLAQRAGENVVTAAGVFLSAVDNPIDHATLFIDTQENGATRELVIADPPQRRSSTGGEGSLSRSLAVSV